MKDWIECQSCWAEFRVVSDTDEIVAFCPYCGCEVEHKDEEDEEENEYEE
jgi:rRNA maturation endonuclease Nob1